MITLNINIDKEKFDEAIDILDSVGMTMENALEVFVKNIIIKQGFPIDLKQRHIIETTTPVESKKVKSKINEEMIQVVWDKFKLLHAGLSNEFDLSDEIEAETGMNKNSAFIYLTIIKNMVQGKENKRNMKVKDFEFFLVKIEDELSKEAFKNSILSLKKSIVEWNSIEKLEKFAASVRGLIDSYQG